MSRYDWGLSLRLASHIEHCRAPEAHSDLDAMLAVAEEPRSSLAVRKMRCAQTASKCLRGAHRGGAPSQPIFDANLALLERLTNEKSWSRVRKVMHAYVDELLGHLSPQHVTNTEKYVAWMCKDMRTSLDSPRSLRQYARTGHVSAAHLSRCFAARVGRTFTAELRGVRMEEARRLLVGTTLKISAICRKVGLRDPSQFVRDFRRETGITPGAYREVHQQMVI